MSPPRLKIEVKGLDRVEKMFTRLNRRGKIAFSRQLYIEAQRIIAEAQKLVPVKTGFLKRSAFTRSQGSAVRPTITAGYTAPYAVYVHEIPPRRGHVQKSDLRAKRYLGRGYKWLARAANVAMRGATQRLLDAVAESAK